MSGKVTKIYFDDGGNILAKEDMSPIKSNNKLGSVADVISNKEPVSTKKKGQSINSTSVSENLQNWRLLSMRTETQRQRLLRKYWLQRKILFKKFDEGIKLDEESWYSVTPECLAKRIAEKCKCDVIIDGFCGAGGNTIQFAFTCKKVIAIDIDPNKIELAKNNAKIYGVSDRIEFIVGDFLQLASSLKADVIFLSPPWGGPGYSKLMARYNIETMLKPVAMSQLLKTTRNITENLAIYLPRNTDTNQLLELIKPKDIEIEQYILNELVVITVYCNDLIQRI